MKSQVVAIDTDMYFIRCYSCEMVFGMTLKFARSVREDNTGFFFCPAGHPQALREISTGLMEHGPHSGKEGTP